MIAARDIAGKLTVRPAELALLVALTLMAGVAWSHPEAVAPATRFSLLAVGFLFTLSAAALNGSRTGWRYWARELLPVPVVPYIFLNLGTLIPLVNQNNYDQLLGELDRSLLGAEVQAALYSIPLPTWFAEILTLAYSSFLFLAIGLVIALGRRRDPYLPQVSAAIIITFLVSYAGYFVVPAYGPRVTVAQERWAALPAGIVGAPLRAQLDALEKTKTDAFPSGHTMVTLAVLTCAFRRHRRLFDVLLPIGSLLLLATVLLTYHYLVDVIAAVPLMVASLALSRLLAGPVPRARARA